MGVRQGQSLGSVHTSISLSMKQGIHGTYFRDLLAVRT